MLSKQVLRVFLAISIYLCQNVHSKSVIETEYNSTSDNRQFRGIVLENGMRVVLVSDPKAQVAAGSLHVGVGSLYEPLELPGLSHFLEHAVYLGNEQYPEENGFTNFLAANGGYDNAGANLDYTTFYYSVLPQALNDSVNQFASLFLSPLFNESALEREIEAVNSENESTKTKDSWKKDRLNAITMSPNHPVAKFSTGSRETLLTKPKENGINVRDELIKFFKTYYSANIMTFGVIGRESLDELQNMVEMYFNAIPNKNISKPTNNEIPYGPDNLKIITEMVPTSNKNTLEFQYLFSKSEYWNIYTMLYKYLGTLIENTGPGTLLNYLKKMKWATDIDSSISVIYRGLVSLEVEITLTEDGLDNYEQVTCAFFQFIRMLDKVGDQKWYWDEQRDLAVIEGQYYSKKSESILVKYLSNYMQHLSIEDSINIQYGKKVYETFHPDVLRFVIDTINPENLRMRLSSKRFENKTSLQEYYLGINYNVRKINDTALQKYLQCRDVNKSDENPDLTFPPKNEFIPKDFTIKPVSNETEKIPTIIDQSDISTVWYVQDTEYGLPQAVIRFELYSPAAYTDPKNVALTYLYATYLKSLLSEDLAPAENADLGVTVSGTRYGIQITLEWYNEKMSKIVSLIAEQIANSTNIDDTIYEIAMKKLLQYLNSKITAQPCELANVDYVLLEKRFSPAEIDAAAQKISKVDLVYYVRNFLSRLHITWMFSGNLLANEALAMSKTMEKNLAEINTEGLLPKETVRIREVEIPTGTSWHYSIVNDIHPRSCTKMLFQNPGNSHKENVFVRFLKYLLDSAFYDQLRTKETLGYTVQSNLGSYGRFAVYFYVNIDSEHNASYVESRIENFFHTYQTNTLEKFTETEFNNVRSSFSEKLSARPKTLKDRTSKQWTEIVTHAFEFNRSDEEVKELDSITLEEFKKFYQGYLGLTPGQGRRLTVFSLPQINEKSQTEQATEPSTPKVIDDLPAWKGSLKLFPYRPPPTQNVNNIESS